MKSKQVWRHRCDFCKKASLNKPAMAKHELHCTGNPNRKCRMCDIIGEPQVLLQQLVNTLNGCSYENEKDKLQDLRRKSNGCPACMLAAIRRVTDSAEEPWTVPAFDFKAERKAFWEENSRRNEEDAYACYRE